MSFLTNENRELNIILLHDLATCQDSQSHNSNTAMDQYQNSMYTLGCPPEDLPTLKAKCSGSQSHSNRSDEKCKGIFFVGYMFI